MKLNVNGTPHNHVGNGTISALLDELGANQAHTALMLNGNVVPSGEWNNTILRENDEIEMLIFVGGG
jgi:thiamine biosynthesis protein ThiS